MPTTSYTKEVVPLVRSVREMLVPFYGNTEILRQKGDSAVTVVTELDIKIEEFFAEELKKRYPAIDFVGEETGGNRSAEQFWLVDPIDGTSHFVRGMPFCTTMLALIEKGEVVFSVIYDFMGDVIYVAEKGKSATMNGTAIHVSKRKLAEAYISFETDLDKEENNIICHSLRSRCVLVNTISSGFEHAMVACGKLDGRICKDPYGKDYDYAAGSLLVAEAGGCVVNIGAALYDYRNLNFIAANPVIFKELTEGDGAVFPFVS
ncbi:MAG: inositol monophosphatase [Candidatus Sungbacteria bacterium]|nr:inositol monophosphatase [bacterium]MDZ4260329.1 inositol monophosphatase [Candidatus Sungbacteria bacterium]